MKTTKTIKELVSKEVVDVSTGELFYEESKRTYSVGKEPNFVKLYFDDLATLNKLPKSAISVLLALLPYAKYADENQIVTINSYTKKQILISNKEIGSTQTINNAITTLKKANILRPIDRATYKINPYIIGKGEWRDILNLRLNIFYSSEGREMTAEVTTKDNKVEHLTIPDISLSRAVETATRIIELAN